jgi:hypothetical protein
MVAGQVIFCNAELIRYRILDPVSTRLAWAANPLRALWRTQEALRSSAFAFRVFMNSGQLVNGLISSVRQLAESELDSGPAT